MHVLGLCGSLRRDSYNRRLLAAATKELPDTAVFEVFDDLAAIPAYDEDIDAHGTPAAVRALRDAIATASGVVIATPEYNASVPGLLKNAIDWASRPYPDHALRGKPVIVVGASTNAFGAVLAQAELRRVLKAIGAEVLDVELPVSQAHEAFAQDGRLANPRLQSQLATMVLHLVTSRLLTVHVHVPRAVARTLECRRRAAVAIESGRERAQMDSRRRHTWRHGRCSSFRRFIRTHGPLV